MGGCRFAVNRLVAARDGEAVVCGAPAVNARVEVNGRGATLNSGVERVGAGFAACAPVVGVCSGVARGFAHACTLVRSRARLFEHGLGRACVSGLFASVLGARVGDPCVCDGSEGLAGAEGDGGGVSALCAGVSALVVVQGCVDGDNVVVVRIPRHRVRVVCTVARIRIRSRVSREGEHAVFCGHDGFTDQHFSERLLFALDPFVDLALCERYADGGEWLALVARGGEGAGGDVGVSCADGGGHGFALVEEDERHACDGARVVGVGVEVCALDDAAVGLCAHVLTVCACDRVLASGVAVAECDGEVGAVAECDDVAVVACHVAAVEELVEVGGELVLVADSVLRGARRSKAVFDVVPRVHLCVFLSVASRLFSFVSLRLRVFYRALSCSSWYHGRNGGVKSPQTGKSVKDRGSHGDH